MDKQKDKPLYVAFSTQKGGAGKTTLTVLMASYLHYVKGNAATSDETEAVNIEDTTFADETDEKPSRQVPTDRLDEAFTDIRINDVADGQLADVDIILIKIMHCLRIYLPV